MKTNKFKLLLTSTLSSALLMACVTIPEPLQGDYTATEPQQAVSLNQNQKIRWGGVVIAVKPEASSTCLEILGKPLSSQQRPFNQDGTIGRFIACKNQFLDPAVISEGREVTITGTIRQIEEREIGEYVYAYPIIDASNIYLWPKRQERVNYVTGGVYFWPYYQPYYNSPRVYKRPRQARPPKQ